MKNLIFLTLSVLILFTGFTAPDDDIGTQENNCQLVCTPEMFEAAQTWVLDYSSTHNQQTEIKVVSTEAKNFSQNLSAKASLGLLSGNPSQYNNLEDYWCMVIGRDVWVPVINANNPVIDQLNTQGITRAKLIDFLTSKEKSDWGEIIDETEISPVTVYYVTSSQTVLDKFLANGPELSQMNVQPDEKQMLSAMQSDLSSIGFCRLTSITDPITGKWMENISVLPLDRNDNGKLDYFEQVYKSPADLARAVWIGKYPHELITPLFLAIPDQMMDETSADFLHWILTDGQKSICSQGYCELVYGERQSKLEKLQMNAAKYESSERDYAGASTLLLVILIVVAGGAIVFGMIRITGRKKNKGEHVSGISSKVINEQSIKLPAGLYFDKTHTWAFMENNGTVKVGIDDFLQHITGPFTKVKFKEPGEKIKKNEPILSLVQDGKHLDIYAPVSGTIRFINENLVTDPSLINTSPYEAGWIYQIEPANWLREIQFMKMAKQYQEWLKSEFSRLKDFLATMVNVTNSAQPVVAYQDGGELVDHVLKDMGPQVWEDFQKNFIDTSLLK